MFIPTILVPLVISCRPSSAVASAVPSLHPSNAPILSLVPTNPIDEFGGDEEGEEGEALIVELTSAPTPVDLPITHLTPSPTTPLPLGGDDEGGPFAVELTSTPTPADPSINDPTTSPPTPPPLEGDEELEPLTVALTSAPTPADPPVNDPTTSLLTPPPLEGDEESEPLNVELTSTPTPADPPINDLTTSPTATLPLGGSLIVELTSAPTSPPLLTTSPASRPSTNPPTANQEGNETDETYSPSGDSVVRSDPTFTPTYAPTSSPPANKYDDGSYIDNYSGGMIRPGFPTETPTHKPTVKYIPKQGYDPLAEETEPDVANFNDDEIFYHGLGDKLGKVGEYLDGVESPQQLETDKNVQIVAGVLLVVSLALLLFTTHMVMQYPDGLCAGCCRLTLKCLCCFIRILCLPCRAICCKGSEQAQGRRTHVPMRTPFPTDLELA